MSSAARMAAEWWAERLEQGDKAKFMDALEASIQNALDDPTHEERISKDDVITKTDYDPFGMLLDAIHAAGVECSGCMYSCRGILPMKTILRINAQRLLPKESYGNWVDEIPVPQDENTHA
jgi:hypothetical protein